LLESKHKTIIERGYDLDIKNPTKQEEEHEYSSAELMEMLKAFSEKQSVIEPIKTSGEMKRAN
jgi:type I restriction enzyme M protein